MQLSADIARKVVEARSRPRSSLADPKLMNLLFQRDAGENRHIVRWGMWAAVLSYMAYGVFDWFLFPDIAARLVIARIAVGVIFLAAIEMGVRRGTALAILHLIAASAIVTGAVAWLLLALGTTYQEALSHFIVFGIVFVLGANLFFNFRFMLSAISSTIIAVVFVTATLFFLQADLASRIVIAALFVNCLVFSLYLSWRLGVERYWTFLEALQAKTQEQAAIEKGQELVEIANTDPLTGLRNRRAIARDFLELYREWSRENYEIGIILVDVDHFKRFNDRLGHQAGDDCLIRLARAFVETAEANDAIVGRYGGEEFIVLCRVADTKRLGEVAQEFCRAVEQLRIYHPDRGDGIGIVTISAGASLTSTENGAEFRAILQEADRALYVSKFAGRARVTIYDPRTVGVDRSSENLTDLLTHAVERQLISVVYQPIFELDTGRLLGHETLMRLREVDGRAISPDVFIPAAEQSGAIVDLGMWVIDQACADMARSGLGTVIAANISAVQLKAPNFSLRVAEILSRHGLAPHQLALEVTERIDLIPEPQVSRNLDHLQNLGVQMWLDDFGTGYAGIGWLRRFEFDIVKIDRSFLNECQTAQGFRMLHGMVSLLRSLGRTVLVEGVETEEQKQLLRRLGVDLVQGYLMGRPEPISEVLRGRRNLVA